MKVVKAFVATLAVVLAIGGIYLYRADIARKASELISGEESIEAEEAEKANPLAELGNDIKKKAVKEITEAVVEQAIKQYGGDSAEDVQKIMDNVSEEDKDKVTEILIDNMSLDAISDVQSYVDDKNVEGLMEYAQDKLTAEDYSELTGIFEKYSDEALKELQGEGN
ncbi:hypothetical protein [Butyrivibrio sp. WCD3002]|uniref:hypothetical protein n=1 Tax=Butyrivibrio sp. WCD3002 TaxID=1280676 RepID=UPI0004017A30|nr:hypothetical protein [Butyrivibrio sp. WCD3002]